MSVNLQKGQKISLDKEAGGALTRITMGLGWDAIKSKGFLGFGAKTESVDLDASCIMFDESNRAIDFVWFRQLKSKDGSVVHTGDNRTGAKPGQRTFSKPGAPRREGAPTGGGYKGSNPRSTDGARRSYGDR